MPPIIPYFRPARKYLTGFILENMLKSSEMMVRANRCVLALAATLAFSAAAEAGSGAFDNLYPYMGVRFQHSINRGNASSTVFFFNPPEAVPIDSESERKNLNGGALSLGLGHKDIPLRGEFEWLFHQKIVDDSPVDGTVSTSMNIMMLNAFYDIKTYSQFAPYIGFGIGRLNLSHDLALKSVSIYDPIEDETIVISYNNGRTKADTSLALQAMLGVGIKITPEFSLDLGYKYASLGNVKSDISINYAITPTGGSTVNVPATLRLKDDNLHSHSFYFGARYSF
jgi:opacity protein-like surface antigen